MLHAEAVQLVLDGFANAPSRRGKIKLLARFTAIARDPRHLLDVKGYDSLDPKAKRGRSDTYETALVLEVMYHRDHAKPDYEELQRAIQRTFADALKKPAFRWFNGIPSTYEKARKHFRLRGDHDDDLFKHKNNNVLLIHNLKANVTTQEIATAIHQGDIIPMASIVSFCKLDKSCAVALPFPPIKAEVACLIVQHSLPPSTCARLGEALKHLSLRGGVTFTERRDVPYRRVLKAVEKTAQRAAAGVMYRKSVSHSKPQDSIPVSKNVQMHHGNSGRSYAQALGKSMTVEQLGRHEERKEEGQQYRKAVSSMRQHTAVSSAEGNDSGQAWRSIIQQQAERIDSLSAHIVECQASQANTLRKVDAMAKLTQALEGAQIRTEQMLQQALAAIARIPEILQACLGGGQTAQMREPPDALIQHTGAVSRASLNEGSNVRSIAHLFNCGGPQAPVPEWLEREQRTLSLTSTAHGRARHQATADEDSRERVPSVQGMRSRSRSRDRECDGSRPTREQLVSAGGREDEDDSTQCAQRRHNTRSNPTSPHVN